MDKNKVIWFVPLVLLFLYLFSFIDEINENKKHVCNKTKLPPQVVAPIEPTITVDDARKTITKKELREFLYHIASEEMGGREPGTDGYKKAAEFLEKEFKSYGMKGANNGSFKQPFRDNRRDNTWNVVAYFPGNDPNLKDEVIVIGAHLDHLGKRGRRIYYGADDNASGSVALMEIAEAIGKIKNDIRRTVLFIAFSSEERGLVGSRYYSNNPLFPIDKTIAMINMDMIGYWRNRSRLACIGASNSENMLDIINEIDDNYPFTAKPNGATSGGSDHSNFAKFRIPICFLHTGTDTGTYHRPSDTPDKIDYEGMLHITRFAFDIWYEIDILDQKPDWRGRRKKSLAN